MTGANHNNLDLKSKTAYLYLYISVLFLWEIKFLYVVSIYWITMVVKDFHKMKR